MAEKAFLGSLMLPCRIDEVLTTWRALLLATPYFTDPQVWRRGDILAWIKWVSSKFSLENLNPDVFPTNGAELCKLSRDDFASLTGSAKSAGILATHLAHLRGLDPLTLDLEATTETPKASTSSSQASTKPSTYLSADEGKKTFNDSIATL